MRSWRLTEAEIDVVRAEAEKIHQAAEDGHHEHLAADLAIDKSWAEVEVRSPMDGVILEKNIVAGDIVDTDLDLFKIADLCVLGVMANVYEEDLPTVEAAAADAIDSGCVQLKSQPDARRIAGRVLADRQPGRSQPTHRGRDGLAGKQRRPVASRAIHHRQHRVPVPRWTWWCPTRP